MQGDQVRHTNNCLLGSTPLPVRVLEKINQFYYFTLTELNTAITQFPYKWSDKTEPVPVNFSSQKKIGRNAHENWCLIRLLPFIIGHRILLNDPAWFLLMSLKDIIKLVVAPVHHEESVVYLDSNIDSMKTFQMKG